MSSRRRRLQTHSTQTFSACVIALALLTVCVAKLTGARVLASSNPHIRALSTLLYLRPTCSCNRPYRRSRLRIHTPIDETERPADAIRSANIARGLPICDWKAAQIDRHRPPLYFRTRVSPASRLRWYRLCHPHHAALDSRAHLCAEFSPETDLRHGFEGSHTCHHCATPSDIIRPIPYSRIGTHTALRIYGRHAPPMGCARGEANGDVGYEWMEGHQRTRDRREPIWERL